MRKKARLGIHKLALHSIHFEEKRVQDTNDRTKKGAEERRMKGSIQYKMLDFLSEQIQKIISVGFIRHEPITVVWYEDTCQRN